MKTHIKSLFVLMAIMCSLTFVTSCNKSDIHSWEARVLEFGSNKPIPNATVYLVEKRGEDILGPVGSTVVDSVTTGADGKFKFKFIDGPVAHYIRGKADLYYETELSRNGNSPSKTKKDLILDPYAWLRLKLSAPDKDVFQFVIHTFGCNPREFLIHDGEKSAETFCLLKGNRENRVEFNIGIYGGNSINEVIKPYLPGLDTTTIELNY